MNFQAVAQANGNKITMFGIFINIGGTQFTPQQKAKSICKIRDDTGAEKNVHIYQGTGQLPQPQELNHRHQFTLSSFQGNYQGKPYVGYSGFWNSNAQTNQNTPSQPQQAPSQPAQATNYQQPAPTQGKQRDYDAENRGKVRTQFIKAAIISGDLRCRSFADVLTLTEFAMTGIDLNVQQQTNANPEYVGDDPPPPTNDDIPF